MGLLQSPALPLGYPADTVDRLGLERIELFHDLFGRHVGDDGIFFPVGGEGRHDIWGVPGTWLDHVALEEELKKTELSPRHR